MTSDQIDRPFVVNEEKLRHYMDRNYIYSDHNPVPGKVEMQAIIDHWIESERRDHERHRAAIAAGRVKPIIRSFVPDLARVKANAKLVERQRQEARAGMFAATQVGRR